MAPQEPKNYGRGALGKLKASFQVVSTTAGTFSPLKAAINELANALDLVEDIAENQESYEELRSELQSTVDSLGPYMDKLDAEARNSSVERIIKSINEQIVQIKKQQEKGKTKQVLGIRENREDLTKRYRQIATLLRQLQSDINLRIWDNTYKQYSEIKLKGLSPVSHAAYNSWYSTVIKRRGCTPGTREPVLRALRGWAQNPHAAKIFWMNGMLGVGKTTIAYSLCEWLENEKQLGASFFCSHSSDDCRSLNGVVPTIAYQLARYSPAFRSSLFHALEDDPDALMRNISTQFEKLIVQPVARVQTALPEGIVVVIDALDECDDRGLPLFELLLKHAVNMPIKFFITSRPESMIRRRILSCQERVAPSVHLDDIEASLVEEDVNTYLTEELGNMLQSPTEVQLRQLAKQSGGSFMCASLLPLYINPPTSYVNSSARLRTILSLEDNLWSGNGPQKLCAPLDLLYHRALDRAFDNMLEFEELQNVQDVLWAVVCGKEPISIEILAALLQLSSDQVLLALQSLHSVLHVSEGGTVITPVHISFAGFLFSESRSGQMHRDRSRQCEWFAHRCFELMKTILLDINARGHAAYCDWVGSPKLHYASRYLDTYLDINSSSSLHGLLKDLISGETSIWWGMMLEPLNLKHSSTTGAPVFSAPLCLEPPISPLMGSLYGLSWILCE